MDLLGTFSQLGGQFVSPFAQRLAGVNGTHNEQLEGIGIRAETARVARINGSGPNDLEGAQRSPASLWDFLSGTSRDADSGEVKKQTYVPMILLAVLGIAATWFFSRR